MPLVSFVLLLLLPTPQAAGQPAASPEAAKAVIEGRVVRAGTGEPLKKASVVLQKLDAREVGRGTTTNAEGYFILEDIEPGRYRLFARRNGYVRREHGQRAPGRPGATLTLAPGQRVEDILFELLPAAVITGRVYDEDGEPTQGVMVQAESYRYVRDRRELTPVNSSTTNDLGEYRIFGLDPGTYYISASYDPEISIRFVGGGMMMAQQPLGDSVEEGYAPTYFPGTNNPAAAAPIELRPGDEYSGVDFLLLPTRTVRVRGQVFNAITGRVEQNTSVTMMPQGEPRGTVWTRRWNAVNPADGSFELRRIIPGSYHLIANWHDGDETFTGRTPVEVGPAGVEGVSVTITAGVEVAGRVRIERAQVPPPGSEAARGKESASLELADLQVSLQSKEEVVYPGSWHYGQVKEDGSLELRNVAQGDYWVRLMGAPPDHYLKAARLGGENVLEQGLAIAGGSLPGPLELTLSPDGARLEGAVLTEDNEPFSGAVVTLVPERRRRDRYELYKSATTDQYGRFTLRGIPPGEYKLFAWEEIESGAYRDPEFLRAYEDRGQEVRLREGEQAAVELELIRPGEAARR